MKLAIMQPYFFPYIGYFQLINLADIFIVYDNIKYTKKGWINRNRFLQNGRDAIFSLPLKNDSDYLNIIEREIAKSFNRDKLLGQINGAYQRAPFFAQTFPLIEQIIMYEDTNLFHYLYNSIIKACEHLGITTKIKVSSDIAIDHCLTNQNKVLALCEEIGATTYINTIGGIDLYSKEDFLEKEMELKFMKSKPIEYPQFGRVFVPWLSIIDVMMWNEKDRLSEMLKDYEILTQAQLKSETFDLQIHTE